MIIGTDVGVFETPAVSFAENTEKTGYVMMILVDRGDRKEYLTLDLLKDERKYIIGELTRKGVVRLDGEEKDGKVWYTVR